MLHPPAARGQEDHLDECGRGGIRQGPGQHSSSRHSFSCEALPVPLQTCPQTVWALVGVMVPREATRTGHGNDGNRLGRYACAADAQDVRVQYRRKTRPSRSHART